MLVCKPHTGRNPIFRRSLVQFSPHTLGRGPDYSEQVGRVVPEPAQARDPRPLSHGDTS